MSAHSEDDKQQDLGDKPVLELDAELEDSNLVSSSQKE